MSGKKYSQDARECPICGKEFCVPVFEEWVYKREFNTGKGNNKRNSRIVFCSWHCLRSWEKQREKEMEERRRKRRNAEP